ncbi:CAP domain-containing protein [Streptomyces tsukubensis]|uniref:Stress protein n=1 Tax=Streptomyces tsukubensis TaxID=83656 RepID=A0A1V3ZYJ8_9ACTN|nr:CAP domain-containing protein [Streptomyces tsukubensis]OON71366.1 stress protein [Streptomyces tsukubensis]QFR92322.1 stress protein [Streptomyces tsukubensis]
MKELVPGGNLPLPDGPVTLRVPGPFDVSALITDGGGKVAGDGDFVFYNQPSAPGVTLRGDTVTVEPARLRPGAARVTVVVSPAEQGTPLARLPAPVLTAAGPGGARLTGFAPDRVGSETVLLLAEVYRRGAGWKLRALGQGYAEGLAGIARDFGVDVADDDAPARPHTAPGGLGSPGAAGRPVSGSGPSAGARIGGGTHPSGSARSGDGSRPSAGARTGTGDPLSAARLSAGAGPLRADPRLGRAALNHAESMAARGRLGVEGTDGRSLFQRVTETGYAYLALGEQLVSGPRSEAEFVEYCLSRETGRRVLLDPVFTHGALGQYRGRGGEMYWTALCASPRTEEALARWNTEVVTLTNAERAAAGLRTLALDTRLAAAAFGHSADMVARDFYSHTSPDGTAPWDRAGTAGSRHRAIAENIACGQRSPAEVVRGWMESPGHRANILTREFTHIGTGFVGGGRSGTYWTQLFGG